MLVKGSTAIEGLSGNASGAFCRGAETLLLRGIDSIDPHGLLRCS